MPGAASGMGKILVTGSSGTIGTRLCERLLESGIEFVGVDKRHNTWSKDIDKLTIIGDLTEKETLERLPGDADVVVHLAANARVYDLVVEPPKAMENIEMLFNILEYCRQRGVRKFIFTSSREVYGNSDRVKHSEEDVNIRVCESPYSASKLGGEALVHSYHVCYGIDFIILRLSNVYGMYDSSDRVIPEFIRRSLENRELIVFGREKFLDFTYIDDCIDGLMKAMEGFEKNRNQTFNLSSGEGITILRTAELIKGLMKGSNEIRVKENRTGEVTRFIGDISRARDSLGYSPRTGIEEGLRKTIQWYKGNPGSLG